MGLSYHDERLSPMKKISNFKFQISNFSNERGVALVVVLWVFMFLFVLAFNFSASVREEGMAAHRFEEETEGYYLALAGFEDGLYRYLGSLAPGAQGPRLGSPSTQTQELPDGSWREGQLGDGFYRVRLVDGAGKINLNRAGEEILRRVFVNLAIDEPRRSILVDSILDWIDEDDLHRINGAESDYYLSLSPAYTAKNGPFDAVEELLWVRGVSPEIFYGENPKDENAPRRVGLREIFTVDSPIDRVNLRTAPAEVIHALIGIPLEKSRAFVEERKKLSAGGLADLLKLIGGVQGSAVQQYFVFVNPSVVTIEAAGRPPESTVERRVKGVVRISGPGGYQLVRWVDRDTGGAE